MNQCQIGLVNGDGGGGEGYINGDCGRCTGVGVKGYGVTGNRNSLTTGTTGRSRPMRRVAGITSTAYPESISHFYTSQGYGCGYLRRK